MLAGALTYHRAARRLRQADSHQAAEPHKAVAAPGGTTGLAFWRRAASTQLHAPCALRPVGGPRTDIAHSAVHHTRLLLRHRLEPQALSATERSDQTGRYSPCLLPWGAYHYISIFSSGVILFLVHGTPWHHLYRCTPLSSLASSCLLALRRTLDRTGPSAFLPCHASYPPHLPPTSLPHIHMAAGCAISHFVCLCLLGTAAWQLNPPVQQHA